MHKGLRCVRHLSGLALSGEQTLRCPQEAHIAIDPRLFRAFRVTAAPTFVVTGRSYELCDGFDCTSAVPDHDRMSGNVTVDYVLERFAEGRGPGAAVKQAEAGA